MHDEGTGCSPRALRLAPTTCQGGVQPYMKMLWPWSRELLLRRQRQATEIGDGGHFLS